MENITTENYDILFGQEAYEQLGSYLNSNGYSKLFILTDSNCYEHCLPYFLSNLPTDVPFEIIEVEAGEENKVLDTCAGVIQTMLELGGDRKSMIITVGGGVITDMGGFIASIFMRGIDFINIPTSLLAMVDASVGGKTGVDLNGIKNCIGAFAMPKMLIIDVNYLETLEARQIKAGYAEMLKHGLIFDEKYYTYLKDIANIDFNDLEALIYHSVTIKNEVVTQDPKEHGLRKILNFGHTVGHAVESYYLMNEEKETLLHGEAVALGMVAEAYIAKELGHLSEKEYLDIKETIHGIYGVVDMSKEDIENSLEWLKFDKKNYSGNIRCVLLDKIGSAIYDIEVSKELVVKGLEAYLN
ncbi:MAG: 3-dehydroquinate synthase [Myroides sp.]|jgi:3-dehydroquinate synthase|uniref:3-dehydroquinate synthase n=1 Tax=Myroides marinus TaxID=703342 RepID=UPI0007420FBD|nr:3-dehydroquinate synthase [Myroides marinus]KUF43187.1 3-dehydroquinate synthase [Myroides marinus]MDR0194939.1 3-dehydroquinate synthase [Myroides sp.]